MLGFCHRAGLTGAVNAGNPILERPLVLCQLTSVCSICFFYPAPSKVMKISSNRFGCWFCSVQQAQLHSPPPRASCLVNALHCTDSLFFPEIIPTALARGFPPPSFKLIFMYIHFCSESSPFSEMTRCLRKPGAMLASGDFAPILSDCRLRCQYVLVCNG